MLHVKPLASERLSLTSFRPEDAEAIITLANDYDVAKSLARLPHPYRPDDAHFFLNEIVATEYSWKVSLQSCGTMIGCIGLVPDADDAHGELGYWYGKDYWGQGYATEAAQVVVDYAFADLAMQEIRSGYFVENPASGAVLQKVGFQSIGQSMQYALAQGKDVVHIDMVLRR